MIVHSYLNSISLQKFPKISVNSFCLKAAINKAIRVPLPIPKTKESNQIRQGSLGTSRASGHDNVS
jgi:hypothetical protein